MKITNISIVEKDNGFIYKKYIVKYNKKQDTILYACDDWGLRFEPYYGNFTDDEFEFIKKELWDDAYYNKNFSIYIK